MAKHRKPNTTHATAIAGATLFAGGMLLAASPIASAGPLDGVNNRPTLPKPAPAVEAIQKAGDKIFPGNTIADKTTVGLYYHGFYGQKGPAVPTEADPAGYQGVFVGVRPRNVIPYNLKCNVVAPINCGTP